MSFTFFTLGGRQFWEDIFICKKWRIQRNYLTKRCRLLDSWDIRRATGTFDECLQSFEKNIRIFQLSKPKEKAIIMIHGLCGNKNQFNRMSKLYESMGFEVAAVNYPSTRKNITNLILQFDFLLNNLNAQEISFIAFGSGGLILRKLLAKQSLWKKRIKINKIIMIDTPNRGYRLWEKLAKYKIFCLLLGPILNDFDSRQISTLPQLPKESDFAIITTNNRFADVLKTILPQNLKILFPQIGDSFLPNARDLCYIKTWHANPLNDSVVMLKCKRFFANGKF